MANTQCGKALAERMPTGPVAEVPNWAPLRRAFLCAVALAMHVLLIFTILKNSRYNPTAPMVTAFIGSVHGSADSETALLHNTVPAKSKRLRPHRNSVPMGSSQLATTPAGHIIPPRADESVALDPAPYARQAKLDPGQGATVVMRIQILTTSRVGDIQIDVSGGSALIDAAAMEYARARRWLAGTEDGAPATLWIRWGVRLQG